MRHLPKTALGWFNFLVLQWFWIRLARVIGDDGRPLGWTFIKARPLSGWWWDFR